MRARCRDVACRKERKTMLSRKVVTRSGRGFRGHFPSKKLNRLVQFESLLERDAIAMFERMDTVLWYREQPVLIWYHDGFEPRKYYPDFELEISNGDLVHTEIKPSVQLNSKKLSRKFGAIREHYTKRPEHFLILTEVQIRAKDAISPSIYDLLTNFHNQKGGHVS